MPPSSRLVGTMGTVVALRRCHRPGESCQGTTPSRRRGLVVPGRPDGNDPRRRRRGRHGDLSRDASAAHLKGARDADRTHRRSGDRLLAASRLGLAARYALGRPRLGMALLVATPLVDLALLAVAAIDLRRGGEASLPHALAAVYVGVSVAWGRRLVDWADVRFVHRFGDGPAPGPPPRMRCWDAAHQRREWLRHRAAWSTGTAPRAGCPGGR